jgi:inorganic triphosphatase YgiF
MPNEIELKLAVPPVALRDAAKLPWLRKLASGPVSLNTFTSVYFDTGKFKLRKHGLTLRVRKIGSQRLQTVKADGASVGGRSEWEEAISGNKPDLKRAKRTAMKPLITGKLKKSLRPVFVTDVRRTVMPLRMGESNLELALDHGTIKAGKSRASVSEIEIELKQGDRRDLVRLAERLRKEFPTAYGARAKPERGYALRAGTENEPVGATKITLKPHATTAEAFTTIGLSCLHHLAANEEAVRSGSSEGVHQMRVGLRRLRAAISVFKELVDNRETEKIKAELKWLTEQLGPARDFDVFVEEGVAPLRKAGPDKPEMKVLETDLKNRRDKAFEKAKAAVTADRYRRVVLDTAIWLIDGAWLRTVATHGDRPIDAFAHDVLGVRWRKIVKRGRKIEDLNPSERHKLRIAVKKLRYASAFFSSLFATAKAQKARKRFDKQLKAMQSALGKLNDIATHRKLARQYVDAGPGARRRPQKAFAVGVLTGREQSSARTCTAAAVQAAKGLAKSRAFWR